MNGVDEFCARSKDGDLLALDELEEDLALIRERVAVKEDERRLRGEAAREPIPHHPAAGGEIKEAIERLDPGVEAMLLKMLKERPTLAVDDAFWFSGRAA